MTKEQFLKFNNGYFLSKFDSLEQIESIKFTGEELYEYVTALLEFDREYFWLSKDDLEFALALQEESKLEAVKWLSSKARPHSLTPLKTAKEILDKYYIKKS